MRILFTALILLAALFTVPSAKAQVQHAGILENIQFEDKNSGNGRIIGIEFEDVQVISKIILKNNVQITRDLKTYLGRYGTAVRWHPRGRYYFPFAEDKAFIGGGANLSRVSYPDSATAKDGYKKWAVAPVISGGFKVGDPKQYEIVVVYDYQFRSQLKSSAYTGGSTNLDGWTTQHNIGAESIWPIKASKWVAIANGSFGSGTYERNPAFYGQQYAGIKYHFNYVEISVGIGRKY